MHQIEYKTLPSKYDMNELEFLRDEFRNGITVKNGARVRILGGLLRDCSYCYGIWGGGGLCSSSSNLRV